MPRVHFKLMKMDIPHVTQSKICAIESYFACEMDTLIEVSLYFQNKLMSG